MISVTLERKKGKGGERKRECDAFSTLGKTNAANRILREKII